MVYCIIFNFVWGYLIINIILPHQNLLSETDSEQWKEFFKNTRSVDPCESLNYSKVNLIVSLNSVFNYQIK